MGREPEGKAEGGLTKGYRIPQAISLSRKREREQFGSGSNSVGKCNHLRTHPTLFPRARVRHTGAMTLLDLPTLAATESLAARTAALARAGDAILLEGPLGAGKTTFARAFLRAACADPALDVPSPSYTLLQSYDTPRFRAHHFDLWRLDGADALAELGWDEARADLVIVEWPDRLGALRPAEALTVALTPAGRESRRAALSGWADRIGGLA